MADTCATCDVKLEEGEYCPKCLEAHSPLTPSLGLQWIETSLPAPFAEDDE